MSDMLPWAQFKAFLASESPALPIRILVETDTLVTMCAISSDSLLRVDCILKKYDTESFAEFDASHRPVPNTTAQVTKGRLWELLQDRAMLFAVWLNGTNPTQIAVRTMWDSMGEEINLNSPMVQYQLIPLLQSEGIIDAPAAARLEAHRALFL